jgi:hypothetical protein
VITSHFESADLFPGSYTGTLVMSCIARSVRTRNVGVTLFWDIPIAAGYRQRVWRTFWLSPKAIVRTKAELARLGIRMLADLDNDPPVPLGAVCRLDIAEVQDRGGWRERRIVRWQVLSNATAQEEAVTDERG